MTDAPPSPAEPEAEAPRKPLSEVAKRALAEAEARRVAAQEQARAREFNGRGGLDPARYGDREIKGRAIDI